MRQKEVVAAYRAVLELAEVRFPYSKAREVSVLRKRLREEYEIAAERELALAQACGVEAVGDGRFRTKDPAKAAKFRKQHEEQMNEDAEIALPQVDLSDFAETLQVSPDCLEALEGIVTFEKKDARKEGGTNGAPAANQQSVCSGERRSPEMSELSQKAGARDMKGATT